ncbi:hypothetical protein [Gimesia maris]|uniref:Uncharacterized protein n=1 Tax=Gimesia maris TaxID=122 RepID=A0ABX5YGR9_9PLAN|nr:hypothetical protein [Gimesia maris]EDL61723.1 hypothetical protein PM8797T_05460 [Gimesia maris DSM 8797]QDT77321.1 hypothetical protein Mal35_07470 [Gimesia maris]QDU12961.1 hypothetical protein CA11_07420 [Gimesia maris]QEG14888.1 hypothetical protein GmarT_07250 [Gimesia maris]QGQ31729.1 hypothetical protein F1729_25580 [Gimesia maris]|tara:strand:- start:20403 stop:22154 length:1752 start_codon:yes stop_codon:yes gene_type:complete
MPSNIELQDAIEQCGKEILETIIDAITPFSDDDVAKRMIVELRKNPETNPFLQFRLAPSIVCRSEIELYCIYMPRFGIRIELGGQEGYGFLTFRRSKLLQKALEAAYADDVTILKKPRMVEQGRYGKLADSVIRIPEKYRQICFKSPQSVNFWNVAQADLLKHYGGQPGECGIPFVTHSDYSGGMCAQACIFMLEMYHIDNLRQINGIADISYLAATSSEGDRETLSIPLRGLEPQSIYNYFKNHFKHHFSRDSQLILSVHNLPDRYRKNQNKESCGHLISTFSADLGDDPILNERILQRIEVEAYARSLIPQITLIDAELLYDARIQPPTRLPKEPDKTHPHAILVVGTKYSFDPGTGGLKEELILNDPATGPLRLLPIRDSLVECARYHDHDLPEREKKIGPPAFESLAILPQGMTRYLAPKQSVPLERTQPVKHFTTGILEDLECHLNLKQEADALQRLILIALRFPTDNETQVTYQNTRYVLAASILAKLKINLLKTGNKTILKDLYKFIDSQLERTKTELNLSDEEQRNWYWLVCLPRVKDNRIQVRLRIYDASGSNVIYKQQKIEALDSREFSLNLK